MRASAFLCVCACVRVIVCVHVCMCLCLRACVHACMRACVRDVCSFGDFLKPLAYMLPAFADMPRALRRLHWVRSASHAADSMQHATIRMQRTARIMQRATYSMQHTTYTMHHATRSVHCTARSAARVRRMRAAPRACACAHRKRHMRGVAPRPIGTHGCRWLSGLAGTPGAGGTQRTAMGSQRSKARRGEPPRGAVEGRGPSARDTAWAQPLYG